MNHLPRPALVAGMLLLLVAVAATAYISLRSVTELSRGAANEERPAEVQRTLLGTLSAVQDAETGQRGYLLTGDPAYLTPYRTARTQADSLLDRLDVLVSWNPVQVERMPGLRRAVDDKFVEIAETVRLFDDVSPRAALAVVTDDTGRDLMDEVRARIHVMMAEATRVRAAFTERHRQSVRRARLSAWGSAGALAVLLAALGVGLRVASRRREQQNEELAEANEELSMALGEREAALGRVRAMQAQLVQQEKLAGMGRLTAGVAHEIKNPLNFVTNFAAITAELADEASATLRSDPDETAALLRDIAHNAGKIQEHGRRADAIVQSMLVHARGVTGERRSIEVADLLEAAAEQARGPDFGDDVDLTVEAAPGLAPVEVVGDSVTRALRNLIENAVFAVRERAAAGDPRYAPAVRLSAHPVESHDGRPAVEITVADNGAGIPDDLFPRIFEPFFTTKGPGTGTGLGLSLAHDIAVGHGGTLLARRREGGGAAFVLTLPLTAPADPDEPPPEGD